MTIVANEYNESMDKKAEEFLKDCFAYKGPSRYIGTVETDGVHWYKWNKRKKRYEDTKVLLEDH